VLFFSTVALFLLQFSDSNECLASEVMVTCSTITTNAIIIYCVSFSKLFKFILLLKKICEVPNFALRGFKLKFDEDV